MPGPILQELLRTEGTQFYRIDHRWQPKNLIPDPYRRNLLKDAQARLNRLEEAVEEFKGLDRAPLYLKLFHRMRLNVKRAQYAWRSDDLTFITNISDFFSDYGLVLQNLKIDETRGQL